MLCIQNSLVDKMQSFLFSLVLLTPFFMHAEDGIYEDKIVFGQVAGFNSPIASMATDIRLGILAAFNEVNKSDWSVGKKLELISINDNYEPVESLKAADILLNENKVFSLIGCFGTAPAKAILPLTIEKNVPLIGTYTGNPFLFSEAYSNLLNVHSGIEDEIEALMTYITDELHLKKFANFYQNDDAGHSMIKVYKKLLNDRNLSLVASASYERNAKDLESTIKLSMATIAKKKPDAVLLFSTYQPAAYFIQASHQAQFKPLFFTHSSSGAEQLVNLIGKEVEGVLMAQPFPSPKDETHPLVKRYQKALRAENPKAKFTATSLEGYFDGRLAIALLEQTPKPITRATFLETARKIKRINIDGHAVDYTTNNPTTMIYLSRIKADGEFEAIKFIPVGQSIDK